MEGSSPSFGIPVSSNSTARRAGVIRRSKVEGAEVAQMGPLGLALLYRALADLEPSFAEADQM